MSRTVIAVWKQGDKRVKYQFRLVDSPLGQGPQGGTELRYSPTLASRLNDPEITGNLVRKIGSGLYKALQEDGSVSSALALAASTASTGPAPIFISFEEFEPEAVPWETLCDGDGLFLSLNERMPIARIPVHPHNVSAISRTFQLPCRLMAIISAAGVSARHEWQALYEAVRSARFPVRLRVLVGESDLMKDILKTQAEPHVSIVPLDRTTGSATTSGAEPQEPRILIEAGFVDESGSLLIEHVRTYNPQLLHFFCHGHSKPEPHLRLASRVDWRTGATAGSVSLAASQFQPLRILSSEISIVALNCCKSAAGSDDVNSLAMSLVKQGVDFPAVVGMREPIASQEANLFSESFYEAIFSRVEDFLSGKRSLEDADWIGAMSVPRVRMVEKLGQSGRPVHTAAANVKEWTLPVIYIRPEPFEHRLPAKTVEQEQAQIKLNTLLDTLRQLQAVIDAGDAA